MWRFRVRGLTVLRLGEARMSYTNRVAVITGASSGIGRALAVALASRGARVGVTARRADRLDELVREVHTAGGTIEAAACDVGDRLATVAAIRTLAERLGPVELLVANAGAAHSAIDPLNVTGLEEMVRVNLLGVAYSFEAVMDSMLARRCGHLVAISSIAAYKGLPGSGAYCATKAAVNTYCEGLRIELRGRGVAVTCVCPGFVHTEMTAGKTHAMPFAMGADAAARRILRALPWHPKVFNFPRRMSWLMGLIRWMPDWVIARMARRERVTEAVPPEKTERG
jgi:short-subunit dehydrogenase